MSDDQQQSAPRSGRRSSFAGQTFADLFGTGRSSMSKPNTSESPPAGTQQMPGPISQAAQQAQQRRMSITTLGLSGSPNQTSPFGSFRNRKDSISSANSGSIDESAIAEDEGTAPTNNGSTPSSPFARRTSFGARALRDIRTNSFGSGGGGSGSPGQNGTRSPPASASTSNAYAKNGAATSQNGTISAREAKGRGSVSEGFNWSDNFRNRAERTSIAAQGGLSGPLAGSAHGRSKSVAVLDPPPVAAIPKPKEQKRPDHFQERILKGDFYMD